MAAKDLALRILINAEDKATSVFTSLKNNAGKVATAITGYFSARFFAQAVEDAAEFEKQMATVAAVSGATGDDLRALEKAAKDMGASTQFTATQAAEALESLARAGLSASDQMEALPSVLSLAQANGIELNQAAGLITQTIAGMGLAFSDAANVADVLTKAAASANTSVEGLGSALSYAAPVAQSMGLTLEETTAFLAKLADAGIDASRAGTSLNNMMIQFQNPASAFNKELAALGINTDDFGEALAQLEGKGNAGQKAILALGQEAGPALRALLNQGIGSVQELTTELQNSNGAAAAAANTMSSNLDGALKSVGSAWDGLRLQLAQPILEPLANALNYVSAQFQQLVTDGSIQSLGQLIANTFEQGAIKAREFFEAFEFEALKTSLTSFGSAAGQVLSTLAQTFTDFIGLFTSGKGEAETFGSAVSTALGVVLDVATSFFSAMDTGLNAIKTLFFSVSGSLASFVSAFMEGVATVQEGIANITFGDVSERWRQEAENSRLIAESFATSAEVNFGKAETALERTADSAEKTRDAVSRMAGITDDAAGAMTDLADSAGDATQAVGLTADELDALGDGVNVINGEVVPALNNAEDAAKTASKAVSDLGANAGTASNDIAAAFETLGVKSSAELNNAASTARAAFETIRDSGQATSRDLQQAFAAYAKAAIEANNGVATEALKVEAALHSVKISSDAAGNSIVQNMNQAQQAVSNVVSEYDRLLAVQQAHIDMQLAEEAAAARVAQARSDQLAANNKANIDNLARTVSRDFTPKEQGYIDQLTAAGADVDAILKNINQTLNNAALKRGGAAWDMESLLRRAVNTTVVKPAQVAQQPAPSQSTYQKTINVNLNVGGKTATGEFPDNNQTRAFLDELKRAQLTS